MAFPPIGAAKARLRTDLTETVSVEEILCQSPRERDIKRSSASHFPGGVLPVWLESLGRRSRSERLRPKAMERRIRILAKPPAAAGEILSRGALSFLEALHRQFEPRRAELLERRAKRQAEFDAGA